MMITGPFNYYSEACYRLVLDFKPTPLYRPGDMVVPGKEKQFDGPSPYTIW